MWCTSPWVQAWAPAFSGGKLLHRVIPPEAGHIPLVPNPDDPIAGDGACPYHKNCLEGLIAGPAIAKRWNGKKGSQMADDPEAMDLLRRVPGAGARHVHPLLLAAAHHHWRRRQGRLTPIVQLARAKTAEALNNYIVTPEVAEL